MKRHRHDLDGQPGAHDNGRHGHGGHGHGHGEHGHGGHEHGHGEHGHGEHGHGHEHSEHEHGEHGHGHEHSEHEHGEHGHGHEHSEHEHGEHGHGHEHGGHGHGGRLRSLLHHVLVPHSHDAAESVDDALESSRQGVRAVQLSLVVLGVTALLQLVVVVVSGSVALLADTVNNLSDALTAVPLWLAFVVGRRPSSRRYTYGFGRLEDLAGLFIVAMIAISAIVAGVESIRRFVEPQPVDNVGWVLLAGLIGFAGNELVAIYRIRVGRRIGSAALVADGVHARTDGFTSLAVVGGAIGIWLGFPLADPIVGVAISAAIVVLLVGTSRDIGRRLLDGVDPDLVDRAERAVASVPGIEAVEDLRMRWSGHRLMIDATVSSDPKMTVGRFHELEHQSAALLRGQLPRIGDVRLNPAAHPDGHTRH